jgi:hypothetical protein
MAIPFVQIDGDAEVFMNETFEVNMKFSNSGNQIGFAPFYDVLLPPGLDFNNGNTNVTFVGTWSLSDNYWKNNSNSQITTHVKPGTNLPANQLIDGIGFLFSFWQQRNDDQITHQDNHIRNRNL